jgi:hypothetical protein
LGRNTSLFSEPEEARRILEPEPGVIVKSKVEYILYRTLMEYRRRGSLSFAYEQALKLPFDSAVVDVHPDFTIEAGGRIYYWEHLGLADTGSYFRDWQRRRKAYETAHLDGSLVTTDDLNGIDQGKVERVIDMLIGGDIATTENRLLSDHHFALKA